MKRYIFPLVALMLLGGIALSGLSDANARAAKTERILSVNDVQADPHAYRGAVTITGVVAALSKGDPKLFALIDTSEAKLCKTTGCAKFYLPVRYEGERPKVGDEVNVAGSFAETGLLLVATKVDVLRHLSF